MQKTNKKNLFQHRCAFVLAVLMLVNMFIPYAGAATFPYNEKTNDKVNMRRSPSGSSVVLERLEQGETVSVTGESGSYYKVIYNERTGYILKKYLGAGVPSATAAPTAKGNTTGTVSGYPYQTTTRDKVNMRRSASSSSVILERLEAGAEITVEGESGKYLEVRYDGIKGYVMAEFVYVRTLATPAPTVSDNVNSDYSKLSRGDKGSAVKSLQDALIELAFLSGNADGEFGSKTETAVKAFQKRNAFSETGIADAALQTLLYEEKPKNASGKSVKVMTLSPLPDATMREGNTGDAVVDLQNRLRSMGYLSGIPSGEYDRATISAVKDFQNMNGLTADGLAGSSTRTKLFSSDALPKNAILTPTPAPTAIATAPGTTVRQGDQGDAAKSVQKRLKELGYLKGSADGKFGSASVAALIAFQKRHGLTQDGVAGAGTQNLLFSANALPAAGEVTPVPATTPMTEENTIVIRMGTRGAVVLSLQKRLTELGYYAAKLDSEYKAADRNAVRAFQSNNGLKADGIAGYETQKALYSSNAVPGSLFTSTPTPVPTPSPALTTLRRGDTGNEVKSLQQRLIQLGYLSGNADGNFGSLTAGAVTMFQQRNGLTADGIAGPTTLSKLYSTMATTAPTATPAPTPTMLRQGDNNDAVKAMQESLIRLGYLKGSADGVFGSNTFLALQMFQLNNGLSTDGVAGEQTLSLLNSATAKPAPTLPGATATPKPTAPAVSTVPKASQVRYANWYTETRAHARKYPYATIYDFNTGLSWKVHMFSLGAHADAEPVSAADTAVMVKAFGGKYTWTPKPVWVVFSDGRVYMATTHDTPHGVEHNTSNNFPGHLCIHFPRTAAEVAAIGSYATTHQKAVEAGWTATQNMIR